MPDEHPGPLSSPLIGFTVGDVIQPDELRLLAPGLG